MAKKASLKTISSGFASNTQLNSNFEALNNKLENTLSLDGSTPNSMGADLDMNGNDIINTGNFDVDKLTVLGSTVQDAIAAASGNIRTIYWEGAYDNATAYTVNDGVSYNGSSYVCILDSTGNLPTDATYWQVFAAAGADGDGSGDMTAATYDPTSVTGDAFDMDNMSESATAKVMTGTERTKLAGIESGADVTDEANVVAALSGAAITGVTKADTDQVLILDASDSNNLKQVAGSAFAGVNDTVFTGDTEFANISDGTTAVPAGYVVNGSAKAWIRFNGTGTVSILNSLNVSSLTDSGTGNYIGNLTNSLTAADGMHLRGSSNFHKLDNAVGTASEMRIGTYGVNHSPEDAGRGYSLVMGDLA